MSMLAAPELHSAMSTLAPMLDKQWHRGQLDALFRYATTGYPLKA